MTKYKYATWTLLVLLILSCICHLGVNNKVHELSDEFEAIGINNTNDIRDLQRENRALEHNISRLKMDNTFDNIDCNLDSIMDSLEWMDYKLNITNQIEECQTQLNNTRGN